MKMDCDWTQTDVSSCSVFSICY